MNNQNKLFSGLFIIISFFILSQVSNADVQSVIQSSPLKNSSNTDYQCVKLAQSTLKLNPADGVKSIPELISCLEGDYFYFDRGAAKIALTHIGQPAVLPLVVALNDSDPRIAEGAAFALGMIGSKAKEAVPALKEILRQKPIPITGVGLQQKAAIALGKIGEVDFLINVLQGNEGRMNRSSASIGLGAAGSKAANAVPALIEILNGQDEPAQMCAANALGEIGPAASPAIAKLGELSNNSRNFVRRAAGEALLKIDTREAKDAAKFYDRRKNLYDGFMSMMSIFVSMPWLAFVVGLSIGLVAFLTTRNNLRRKRLAKVLYTTSMMWIIYTAWEFYSRSIGANIRIDLLVIYPFLFIITLFSTIFWFMNVIRTKSNRFPGD